MPMAAKSGIHLTLRDLVVALRKVDWHHLGTQLNIPQEELKRIDEECHDINRKMTAMLDYWINNKKISWKKILNALERIGGHENLIHKLNKDKIEDNEGQADSDTCLSISTQTEVVNNGFSMKSVPSENQVKDFQYVIKRDLEELGKKFITLKREIRESLKKKVSPEEIVSHVLSDYEDICQDIRQNTDKKPMSLFSDDVEKKLNSATSVDQVFQTLKNFWSFLKCDILYSIVNHCGDDTDRIKVEKYQEELRRFFDNRKVSEVPEELMLSSFIDETRDKMLIKLDKDNPPWSDITDLEYRICKILGIMPSALLIIGVRQGCVEITFSIPKHISQLIFSEPLSRDQQDSFREASVLKISCGHIQLTFFERKEALSEEGAQPHSTRGQTIQQLISQHLRSLEESTTQHEQARAEKNQLQECCRRKSKETEELKRELGVLRYRIPPSHKTSMVETLISANEAEMEELKETIEEVKDIIELHNRISKNSKRAIEELLEKDQSVHECEKAALVEAHQSQKAALEKKLLTMIEAKDDEIKRCKSHLNQQRIKLTSEYRATCEKQEMHYSKSLREIEGRCQRALKSAETQHVAELQSKNEKIRNLETKVKALQSHLLVRQSAMHRLRKWFKRRKSTVIDESKHGGTRQGSDQCGELKNRSQLSSKYPVHSPKEHDQASSHASTISPPLYYDQYSLHSLPAMHFREVLEEGNQDQSSPYYARPNRVISPQKSEDSAEGYRSEPEDEITLLLNPRINSTTATV